jgi:hypothetical protein
MTPPFVFLDRIHVTQGIARLLAGLKALWSHGRGALLPIAVPLLAVYLMGALLFGGRYLPGTRVNGMNASWKTPAALLPMLPRPSKSFAWNMKTRSSVCC